MPAQRSAEFLNPCRQGLLPAPSVPVPSNDGDFHKYWLKTDEEVDMSVALAYLIPATDGVGEVRDPGSKVSSEWFGFFQAAFPVLPLDMVGPAVDFVLKSDNLKHRKTGIYDPDLLKKLVLTIGGDRARLAALLESSDFPYFLQNFARELNFGADGHFKMLENLFDMKRPAFSSVALAHIARCIKFDCATLIDWFSGYRSRIDKNEFAATAKILTPNQVVQLLGVGYRSPESYREVFFPLIEALTPKKFVEILQELGEDEKIGLMRSRPDVLLANDERGTPRWVECLRNGTITVAELYAGLYRRPTIDIWALLERYDLQEVVVKDPKFFQDVPEAQRLTARSVFLSVSRALTSDGSDFNSESTRQTVHDLGLQLDVPSVVAGLIGAMGMCASLERKINTDLVCALLEVLGTNKIDMVDWNVIKKVSDQLGYVPASMLGLLRESSKFRFFYD